MNTPTTRTRVWVRIGMLMLVPAVIAALLATALTSGSPEALAEVPETTTTTAAPQDTPEGFDHVDLDDDVDPIAPKDGDEDSNDELPADEDSNDEEEPMGDGLDDPPANPLLDAPSEVSVDGNGYVVFPIYNLGELDLEVTAVNTYGNPIVVNPSGPVGAYDEGSIELIVDMTQMPLGEFALELTIETNGGIQDMIVTGFKYLIAIPQSADLEFGTNWVIQHGVHAFPITITNNEDSPVVVTLATNEDRLFFAPQIELQPGENDVWISIQALDVSPLVIDQLDFTISWDFQEVAVTITKHGS